MDLVSAVPEGLFCSQRLLGVYRAKNSFGRFDGSKKIIVN
jgi:hypothetical protein